MDGFHCELRITADAFHRRGHRIPDRHIGPTREPAYEGRADLIRNGS